MQNFIKAIKRSPLVTLWIVTIFLISGLIVNFCQLLLLLLVWPFSKRWYRMLVTKLAYLMFAELTFLAFWWANMKVYLYIDKDMYDKVGSEHAIVVGNHRGDIDWLTGWLVAEDRNTLGSSKVFIKDIVKYMPVIGWCFWFAEFGFLKRNWETDKDEIMKTLQALKDYPTSFLIGIYPEGTRLTPGKLKSSQEFALSKGFQPLRNHLYPKVRGFVTTINGLKGIAHAVYDLETVFEKEEECTMAALMRGESVTAHVSLRRFPFDSVPTESYEETANWCKSNFIEKDALVDYFKNNNNFPGQPILLPRSKKCLMVVIFWFIIVTILLLYGLRLIILSKSLVLYGVVAVLCTLGTQVVSILLNLCDTKKGSTYGLNEIQKQKEFSK